MKIKFLFATILIVVLVLVVLNIGEYTYIRNDEVQVISNEDGNPTLLLDGEQYLVRFWNVESGCYKLTNIPILNYSVATRSEAANCSFESASSLP